MEILIIGGIIVALMVYASTKIKKVAAEAFEPETIDAEHFTLVKPEGFLHPYNENSEFAFEAYTKNFGDDQAKKFRQARATLRVIKDLNFDEVCKNAKKSAGKILSKNFSENAPAEQKIFLLEGEKIEQDVKIRTFYKIVESRGQNKIYELQIYILESNLEEFREKAVEMLETFRIK